MISLVNSAGCLNQQHLFYLSEELELKVENIGMLSCFSVLSHTLIRKPNYANYHTPASTASTTTVQTSGYPADYVPTYHFVAFPM